MASQKITSFFGKRVSPASTQVEASKKRPRLVGEASTATESTSSGARASVDASGSVSSVVPAKHKTGYDPRWEKKFPWVYLADDGLGMYCRLCQRFNTRNERNRSAVFNETPCVSLRCDVLHRHAYTEMHATAVHMEEERLAAEASGGITGAIRGVVSAERMTVIAAMKCLYWLAKNEVPHTTKYQPLLQLLESMNCPYVESLKQGRNATYTSEMIIQDFLSTMASQVEEETLRHLMDSPYIGLMCDESTDISVLKQLVLYGRFIDESGTIQTAFLEIKDLFNGTAETIEVALMKYCDDRSISWRKVMGFGSDGAAVMTGRRSGVATRLKVHNPHMVSIHCVAHRLALAAAQSADAVPYLKKFKNVMTNLYKFYQNSPVRMAALHSIQETMETPTLKLKEAKDVRWLSHDAAVQTLKRTLPSVIASLEREAVERGEPIALGLVKMIKTYNFVASLYLFSDVLPHICRLSKIFQDRQVDLSMIKLSATLAVIQRYEESPSPSLLHLDSDLDTIFKDCDIQVGPTSKENFKANIQSKYIKAVLDHLQQRLPDVPLLDAFSIFDPAKLQDDHLARLQVMIDHYATSATPVVNEESLRTEWEMFQVLMRETYPTHSLHQIQQLLVGNTTLKSLYPNLSTLASIALILPVTTADCERAFSTMKRVKTEL